MQAERGRIPEVHAQNAVAFRLHLLRRMLHRAPEVVPDILQSAGILHGAHEACFHSCAAPDNVNCAALPGPPRRAVSVPSQSHAESVMVRAWPVTRLLIMPCSPTADPPRWWVPGDRWTGCVFRALTAPQFLAGFSARRPASGRSGRWT